MENRKIIFWSVIAVLVITVSIIRQSSDNSLGGDKGNASSSFSIHVPEDFKTDNSSPDVTKFTIPESMTKGTNLSTDTYISVEKILSKNCPKVDSVTKSNGAAAGNRYEEAVYTIVKGNSCVAVHYLIHWGVFENYPEGSIKEFDKKALTDLFDKIRATVTI